MAQHEISIYEEIGASLFGGLSASMFKEKFDALGVKPGDELTVRINSPGGDVWDAWAIYNLIRESKAEVTTKIDGICASAASFIALAADEVQMHEAGLYMIHNPLTVAIGNAAEMRRVADMLDKHRDTILPIYKRKTGKTAAALIKLLDAETWFSAAEAKTEGFVDTIIKGDRAKMSFDFSAFKNVPEWVKAAGKDAEPAQWRRALVKRRIDIDAACA